jgi:hypothetical protein
MRSNDAAKACAAAVFKVVETTPRNPRDAERSVAVIKLFLESNRGFRVGLIMRCGNACRIVFEEHYHGLVMILIMIMPHLSVNVRADAIETVLKINAAAKILKILVNMTGLHSATPPYNLT